jgi:hypothetical protein
LKFSLLNSSVLRNGALSLEICQHFYGHSPSFLRRKPGIICHSPLCFGIASGAPETPSRYCTIITEGRCTLALIKTHVIMGPVKYTVKLQEIQVMNIRHQLRYSLKTWTTEVQPLTATEGAGFIRSPLAERDSGRVGYRGIKLEWLSNFFSFSSLLPGTRYSNGLSSVKICYNSIFFIYLFISSQNCIRFYKLICCDSV